VPDTTKDSTPEQQPSSEETAALERLEKEADGMAEKAQDVEKKYDDDHGIFTK
jgi:hypothetical protein